LGGNPVKSLYKFLLGAALVAATIAPAKADVIYTFTQTTAALVSPNSIYTSGRETYPFTASMLLVVTDEAAANGFTMSGGYSSYYVPMR
jgi:hypothetical protein